MFTGLHRWRALKRRLDSSIPGQSHPSRMPTDRGNRGSVVSIVIVVLALPLIAGGALLAWHGPFSHSRKAKSGLPTETVRRGPLEIKITEHGNVDSSNNLTMRCRVEGGTGVTILKLAEEGTRIEPGQVVVELDSSKLREDAVTQQIRLESAEA